MKILACRILHRDMTLNALHLMQRLRAQVVEDLKVEIQECLYGMSWGMVEEVGQVEGRKNRLVGLRSLWMQVVREEVVENDDW
jgi:hypothetical protein